MLDVAKCVYVARDPRDVIVSVYHITKNSKNINCTIKDFFDMYVNNLVYRTPHFEHLKEAWELRHHPNLLFLFYEELSKDLKSVAKRVAKFLGKEYTEEQFDELCEHLKFDKFSKNELVSFNSKDFLKKVNLTGLDYVRKGKVGGWRDYFDEEMTQRAEQWMKENLKDVDISWDF